MLDLGEGIEEEEEGEGGEGKVAMDEKLWEREEKKKLENAGMEPKKNRYYIMRGSLELDYIR